MLNIFGKTHNWMEEIELFDDSKYGMDITIVYKEGSWCEGTDVRHNCTEFHHRYNKKTNEKMNKEMNGGMMSDSSAFESDIHQTGGTMPVENIESITIVKAKSKNYTHFETIR